MHSIPMQSPTPFWRESPKTRGALVSWWSNEEILQSIEIPAHFGAPNSVGHSKEEKNEMETLRSSLQ